MENNILQEITIMCKLHKWELCFRFINILEKKSNFTKYIQLILFIKFKF